MAQEFYVGDKVRTFQHGVGYVEQVDTWKDAISDMISAEAIEFSNLCKKYYGDDYRNKWYRLHVKIKGKTHVVESLYVEMVEPRPRGG